MTPGVIYTAPDGSTVCLQIYIKEGMDNVFNPGTKAEWHLRPPDRVMDARLACESASGIRYVARLHSKAGVMDSVYDIQQVDHLVYPKKGIITDRLDWE